MKKIERRAFLCKLLALLLSAGLLVFVVRWCVSGGRWAAASFNRHLYNSAGQLASGSVLDRDGDVLSWAENGERKCYDGETVRKATLHTVGDLQGSVATGVLRTYADALTGYSLLNGAYGAEQGRSLSHHFRCGIPEPHHRRLLQLRCLPGPEWPQGGRGGL